jgi:hypothetical protein
MSRHADYVYRNQDDTLRVRVHRRENGHWDYDVFLPNGDIKSYSEDAGDDFYTKRDAVAEANYQYGPLRSIAVKGNVVDDEWYARHVRTRRRREASGGGSPGPFGGPGAGPRR